MTTLITPPIEKRSWPSLGGAVCDFIEGKGEYEGGGLVFGPGPLLGSPAVLDEETRWIIWRLYEVFPRGHDQAGRRRFTRAALSLRKGTAKSEKAAWITAAELAGPVRCGGWLRNVPIGIPVHSAYIPMLASSLDQAEDVSYGALKKLLERSPIAKDFEITEGFVRRLDGSGEVVPVADSPSSRDGARTSFEHFDETHLLRHPRLIRAHQTMILNLPKQPDAWALETTTRQTPGQASVAENTEDYARQVASGTIRDSRLFFLGRWASEKHDIETEAGLRAAIDEASGPYQFTAVEAIVGLFQDPTLDRSILRARWLNQLVQATDQAFDAEKWKTLAGLPDEDEKRDRLYRIPAGALVVGGFDGSRRDDDSGLIVTEVETGFQQKFGHWRPADFAGGEITGSAVSLVIDDMFTRFNVWRLYADPPYWESELADWTARYGDERVVRWATYRDRAMGLAVRAYAEAILTGGLCHDGDAAFTAQIANARRRLLGARDDKGEHLWTIEKEREHSPLKVDLSAAGILSWQARTDAVAAGAMRPVARSVYEDRGIVFA